MPKYSSSWIWREGEFLPEAGAPLAGWGQALRSGAGAFETLLVKDGVAPFAERHHFRLREATCNLSIQMPWKTPADLSTMIKESVEKSSLKGWVRFRLQLNALEGEVLGKALMQAIGLIDLEAVDSNPWDNPVPVLLGSLNTEVLGRTELSMFKTTQRGVYQLGERWSILNKWDDCLLWGSLGIAESTRSNLWWIRGHEVFTPPISTGCVAGVMRHMLYQELVRMKRHPVESLCNLETLASADCVFLTNAFRGIQPVSDDGPVKGNPSHPLLKELQERMLHLRDGLLGS